MRRFEFECQNCGWKTENIGEKHFCPKDEKNKEEIKSIWYDHERVVAELKAEHEQLRAVVTAPQMQYEEEITELRTEVERLRELVEELIQRLENT